MATVSYLENALINCGLNFLKKHSLAAISTQASQTSLQEEDCTKLPACTVFLLYEPAPYREVPGILFQTIVLQNRPGGGVGEGE